MELENRTKQNRNKIFRATRTSNNQNQIKNGLSDCKQRHNVNLDRGCLNIPSAFTRGFFFFFPQLREGC